MSTPVFAFNWAECRRFVKKRRPVSVDVGRLSDWYWSATPVFENGRWLRRNIDRCIVTDTNPGFKAVLRNGDTIEVPCARKVTTRDERRRQAIASRIRKDMNSALAAIRKDREARQT